MNKTMCDFCGKEITDPYGNHRLNISSYGRMLDMCNECREELNKWIAKRKTESEKKVVHTTQNNKEEDYSQKDPEEIIKHLKEVAGI